SSTTTTWARWRCSRRSPPAPCGATPTWPPSPASPAPPRTWRPWTPTAPPVPCARPPTCCTCTTAASPAASSSSAGPWASSSPTPPACSAPASPSPPGGSSRTDPGPPRRAPGSGRSLEDPSAGCTARSGRCRPPARFQSPEPPGKAAASERRTGIGLPWRRHALLLVHRCTRFRQSPRDGTLGPGGLQRRGALLFREFRLDLIGVRVPGKVVGIQGGRMSDGGGGGGGGGYKMPYSASVVEYRTLDGDVIRQPHVYRYGGSLRPPEAVGDTVEVLYLPKNPTVFRIAGEPFAAWIGSFLFGLGLSFLVFAAALDGVLPESASPGAACVGAVLLASGRCTA